MNCCDENGRCTDGENCATRSKPSALRSCDELAVCQSLQPRCAGCGQPDPLNLAPGVIDCGEALEFDEVLRQRHRRELLGAMFRATLWMGVCVATAFAAGLISGVYP